MEIIQVLKLNLISLLLLVSTTVYSQSSDPKPTDTVVLRSRYAAKIGTQIDGSDTLSVFLFKKFVKKGNRSDEEKKAYANLVRYVRKALPYAKLAAYRLQLMEDNLRLLNSEKERKKYIKACEKSIKQQFMDDLKNMYVEEGRILLKLIYRETGKSTWDIMKNYGGTFETLMYQAVAKTYKADMKVTYDPVLDYQIEEIVRSIEAENVN